MRWTRLGLPWHIVLSIFLISATALPAAGPRPARDAGPEPPRIKRPLIAHWSFDEPSSGECLDSSGNGHHASPERRPAPGIARTAGVFGGAVEFSGSHILRVPGRPRFTGLAKVSFSAWVMPTELKDYREVFRKEDGDRRVLFSFQDGGTHLSLGLNVGGYVECDAEIDPARVLDGAWHHSAATFDGRVMRVYLDGREIGSLPRQGTIAAGGSAPGCIGSSNGGECFQGVMDDLRIYADALTGEEILLLYRSGLESIQRLSRESEKKLQAFYFRGTSLAETLSNSRKSLLEKGAVLDRGLAGALLTRLRADFPKDYETFAAFTGGSPLDFLTAKHSDFYEREAGRLVALLVEYKPLTDAQWARQTPAERRRWEEAAEIEKRFEKLKALGDAARFSPEWIEIILAAGPKVQFRPYRHEAVAPYVPPATPATRNLSAAEAREALQRDWLHQADGNPTLETVKSEIAWTRHLAARIERAGRGAGPSLRFSKELAELDALEKQGGWGVGPSLRELYFRVRQIKRGIMLKNPAVDFDKVLLVDMPYPQGSEWQHETRHRLGYMAVPGGRLLVLEGLSPEGKLTQLMPQAPLHGSFWRPDLSYDARKVLFSFKPHNEKSFHLYEINVDGTGLVQLTDGPYDDLDPIYLPDDRHVIFSTTRGHTYVRCMPPTNAYVLARCDRDGKNVYLISSNNEPDYLPSVTSDGRVIYTRWEYTDKPLWRAAKLWTVNPDGTQVATFWGNQSVWPDLVKDARSIPGSRRVMFTGSAHHNWFSGSVGIIDPDGGFNFPDGLTKITADVPWPECGNGPVDPVECREYHPSGLYPAYYSPYPLGEQDFLVSAQRGGKFLLYLMDVYGNRELIYEGTNNIFHAMPLAPRPRPPVIADRVAWPDRHQRLSPQGGVLYSGNVYQNAPPQLKGQARYLRVLHIDPKTYTYWYMRPYISTGPVISTVQSEGVKRVLGTVPIETDGSVAFDAPPGMALHFQLLDENGRALQTMRSFVGLMPGERRGCLGCHESHSRAPQYAGTCTALAKDPRPITPPPWSDNTVSYPRYVQPVLDKYCVKCHQETGEGMKAPDLSPRPGFLGFAEPYHVLTGRPSWGTPYQRPPNAPPGFGIAGMLIVEGYGQIDPAGYKTPTPMTSLSYKSRLVELCSSGKHYDVQVDPQSLERIIAWVDAMCPYLGDEEVREIPDPVFQGVDWLAVRPRIRSAPRIVRPGPVDD